MLSIDEQIKKLQELKELEETYHSGIKRIHINGSIVEYQPSEDIKRAINSLRTELGLVQKRPRYQRVILPRRDM